MPHWLRETERLKAKKARSRSEPELRADKFFIYAELGGQTRMEAKWSDRQAIGPQGTKEKKERRVCRRRRRRRRRLRGRSKRSWKSEEAAKWSKKKKVCLELPPVRYNWTVHLKREKGRRRKSALSIQLQLLCSQLRRGQSFRLKKNRLVPFKVVYCPIVQSLCSHSQ